MQCGLERTSRFFIGMCVEAWLALIIDVTSVLSVDLILPKTNIYKTLN